MLEEAIQYNDKYLNTHPSDKLKQEIQKVTTTFHGQLEEVKRNQETKTLDDRINLSARHIQSVALTPALFHMIFNINPIAATHTAMETEVINYSKGLEDRLETHMKELYKFGESERFKKENL